MKPRKVYLRNNILHVCYKSSHYAPEPGEETKFGDSDRVVICGGVKGCPTVDVRYGPHKETWVKTNVDAADPRNEPPCDVIDWHNNDHVNPEDDEADLLEEEARIKTKAAQAQSQGRAQKVMNILDL